MAITGGREPAQREKALRVTALSQPEERAYAGLVDRLCEIPRRGGELPERVSDGDHTHACVRG